MGKMINVLMIFVLIELAVGLFITGCIGGGSGCEEQTSLVAWILNPQDWTLSSLLGIVINNIFLIGGATAITVGTLWMKSEFLVYAGLTSTLLGFGQTTYRLWQEIGNLSFFGEAIGSIIATIALAGLFIYVLVTMLDFARGRD